MKNVSELRKNVKTESKKQNNEATKYQLVILLIETSWHRDHFFEETKNLNKYTHIHTDTVEPRIHKHA